MAVVFILSTIALLIYTAGSPDPTVHVLDIPPGSSEAIGRGENPLEIPSTWGFYADDTLVLDNRDSVGHTLGNWYVPPNTVRQFELQPVYGGFFACSLHPSGGVTLEIKPRDFDFSLMAAPVLGFGFTAGIILWIVRNVVRALGRKPYVDEYFTSLQSRNNSASGL